MSVKDITSEILELRQAQNWQQAFFELNKEMTRLIQENIELKDKIRDYEVKELRFETTLRNL